MQKSTATLALLFLFYCFSFGITASAQMMRLPETDMNYKCNTGRTLATTNIEINWNAPGVKGRDGKIWGTDIAWYGFKVLGFGSYVASPWRAGANECTTVSFSTDVTINGKQLAAGKYAFFIALQEDSVTLIFNRNHTAWGSYFYNEAMDVLRVKTIQQKNRLESMERLTYGFTNQTEKSVEVYLDWEKWRIPFVVEIDVVQTTLAFIKAQMSGAAGFDPPSLEAAAFWCLQHKVNLDEALTWINTATDPNLGGVNSFKVLSVKAGLLQHMHKTEEAGKLMKNALQIANVMEIHNYGRQLLNEKRTKEALEIFVFNFNKFKGAWPTNAGLMRGYAASGDLKKALEYAKAALAQAPNAETKKIMADAVEKLSLGKAL